MRSATDPWSAPPNGSSTSLRNVVRLAAANLAAQPHHRVEIAIRDPLFYRDDAVVGDLDVFRAVFLAALGDVAEADPGLLTHQFDAVVGVERMHVEFGVANEQSRSGERGLVLLVVTDHVTDVLADEAFDALAELLQPIDVALLHPIV